MTRAGSAPAFHMACITFLGFSAQLPESCDVDLIANEDPNFP